MSRSLYLAIDEGQAVAECLKLKVGISAIERLPGGGVRLVCMSSDGAARVRKALKSKILDDDSIARDRHRPRTPLW